MPNALQETLATFKRTPLISLLSIVAIGLSLFMVGLFALTAFNIRRAIEQVEARVEVVAYLRDGTRQEQVEIARQEMLALPEVREVIFVSKTEALATAVQEMEEFQQVFTDLEVNPLPASLEVRLKPGYRHSTATESLAQQLFSYPFVEDVQFGREWVAKIVSLRRIAAGASAVIGGAFAAVAGILIATAVRISIFARREEIEIMQLVGATDGFIQRPFLVEGLLSGLLGGLLAVGLTFAAHQLVSLSLLEIAWLPLSWVALGIGSGTLYGLLASALSVQRHLRAL